MTPLASRQSSPPTGRSTFQQRSAPSVTVIDLSRQSDDHESLRAFARDAVGVIAVSGAMHAQSGELQSLPGTALLIRPLSVGTVADAVDEVVRPRAHGSPSSLAA